MTFLMLDTTTFVMLARRCCCCRVSGTRRRTRPPGTRRRAPEGSDADDRRACPRRTTGPGAEGRVHRSRDEYDKDGGVQRGASQSCRYNLELPWGSSA
jgi:hypothetical protein